MSGECNICGKNGCVEYNHIPEMLMKKINRTKNKINFLESKHKGNERNYTYWGGFDLGYLKGKLSVLEDIADDELEKILKEQISIENSFGKRF